MMIFPRSWDGPTRVFQRGLHQPAHSFPSALPVQVLDALQAVRPAGGVLGHSSACEVSRVLLLSRRLFIILCFRFLEENRTEFECSQRHRLWALSSVLCSLALSLNLDTIFLTPIKIRKKFVLKFNVHAEKLHVRYFQQCKCLCVLGPEPKSRVTGSPDALHVPFWLLPQRQFGVTSMAFIGSPFFQKWISCTWLLLSCSVLGRGIRLGGCRAPMPSPALLCAKVIAVVDQARLEDQVTNWCLKVLLGSVSDSRMGQRLLP